MTDVDIGTSFKCGDVTAEFVRNLQGAWTGSAALWRVGDEYVVTSATIAMFSGPETYVFAADADGEVTSWSELEGSFRGGLDHLTAIEGYVTAKGGGNDD